jgi:DNA-binding LacI/PurR family transcriptional regulator
LDIDFQSPIPLYRQVGEHLKSEIISGKLRVGDQIGSQQELAEKYRVSLITVKRAVAELTNEGFLYSRVGKGTYVLDSQPRKEGAKSKTIGLVLRDLKSPFFSMIVHGAEEFASQKGFSILVSNSSSRMDKEEQQIANFMEYGVAGMIIASMTHEYTANNALRKLHNTGFPYVVVSYVKDPDIFFVGTDHEQGGYLAAQHLIRIGHKKIGYVNGEEGNLVGELRMQGFLRALREHGLDFSNDRMYRLRNRGEWHDFNSGYEIGEKLASLADCPKAMFVYNDLAALGFSQALLDKGRSIPDDVAIIGFDGIERGRYATVPLTTIQQPVGEIGAKAVENLMRRIDHTATPLRTILPPSLIVRESCGAKLKTRTEIKTIDV